MRKLMKLPLLTEGIEGKRCWLYKKMAERKWVDTDNVPNPYNGAGDVQDFLIFIGYKIEKDWSFGDKTASALGTWKYGKSKGIDSVNKLWLQLKKGGYDVGNSSGYGPKMMKAVAEMIVDTCTRLAKTCKVDQQTLFDMEFGILPQSETDCRNNLDSQFKKAIKYWDQYLSTPQFKERILNKNPKVEKDGGDLTQNLYKKIFNYYWGIEEGEKYSVDSLIDLYKIILRKVEGWKFVSDVDYNMASSNPISVNHDVFCKKDMYEKAYYTFVHELQHILSNYYPLNDWSEVKKAYPLSTDHYSNQTSKTKLEIGKSKIPIESKNELIKYNIDYEKLSEWASNPSWLKSYWCDRNEKLSNLQNFRAFLSEKGEIEIGGNITVGMFSKYLKKYISNPDDKDLGLNTNFEELIVCWAQNNFSPKLSEFIKELNSLAKIDSKEIDGGGVDKIDSTDIT